MEKLDINKYEIKNVLKYFEEVSNIPRESGNEEGVKNYLVEFAKKRNFEFVEDGDFNVIIKRKADIEMESMDPICLQAHTDMICEKRSDVKFDFFKDSIKLYTDGKWIFANGTSLGADNGIGVAIILAILDDKNLKLPKIEAVFTVQEETTMIGAKNINLSNLESKKMISLDGGNIEKILVCSANCLEWIGELNKEFENLPSNFKLYKLEYSGFLGGHSGGNIGDKERGNPIKLGIDAIKMCENLYIKNIKGGSRVNVIPRDFCVEFVVKEEEIERVKKEILNQQNYYGDNGFIKLSEINIDDNDKVFSKKLTNKIINFVSVYENGALEYIEENIVLSCNLGAIKEDEEKVIIEFSTRSNDMNLRNEYLKRLEKNIESNELNIIWSQELKGVEQNINKELINMCCKLYKNLYNKEMEKIITQGVIEGGFFADKIQNLEYVCLGTNIENPHSPDERVEIESIGKVYNFLVKLLYMNK